MKHLQEGQSIIFRFRGINYEGTFLGNTAGGNCMVRPIDPSHVTEIKVEFYRNYLILKPSRIKPLFKKLKENNPNVTFKLNDLEVR